MTRPSHANASEETLKRAAAGKGSSGVATLHEPATITPAPLSPAFAAPTVNKDQLNLNKAVRERAMEMQRERRGKRGQVNATATTIVFLAKGAWHNKLQQVNAH